MEQPTIGSERDEEDHRVARLAHGHGQHVRHDPPRQLRSWAETEAGYADKIDTVVECLKSDRGDPAE